MTSEQVQQYIRVALYYGFGALGAYGLAVPDNAKAIVVSVAGVLANLGWTIWGTRLNALIAQIAKSPDVQKVVVASARADAVTSAKVIAS